MHERRAAFDDNPAAAAPGARVVAPYAHTLWDAARGQGLSEAELAALLGRAAIGDADVPIGAYLAVLALASARGSPAFGWCLGQGVKPTTYGVNGILLLACPTLGEALQQVLRFESLVHDLGRSSLAQSGDQVVYAWRNDCASHCAAGTLTESVFAGIQTCAQWLVGRTLNDFDIEFTHQADAQTVEYITRVSGARVRWGAGANRAIFAASVLAWPIPQANTALLPLLQRHADELLQARHPREGGIVAQVRQCISGRLGQGAVKLADVAADLHLSTRTLQRRLLEAGVAYQALLDATRHELARHYLGSSAMPIAELAYLLGFQDAPAFHHAFKTWQGQGPGQYRTAVATRS
ncbi:AraC family transcriptional regulator ligand-binding domain-containing protein [Rhodoferax sp.]|uniref:AraC family transcriptional regulator n=1 Tax=Rhodoferax sp. TaxID=50421 RepID=UPI0027715BE7|nr:AraC family transcriptional regulator ligand-binding domain-containing protein [Rhodoferax sp.]